jgi:adenylyltransferase/sulfurtransferase
MGCLQATEAIKYILGRKEGLLSGRVLVFDALRMTFKEAGLDKTPGRQPITSLIDYQGFCGGPQTSSPPAAAQSTVDTETGDVPKRTMDEAETAVIVSDSEDTTSFHSILPEDCMSKLVNGWNPFVLDVRLETENAIVALPFTDRIVPHRVVGVKDIPKDGDVLVYCKGGVRGKKACTSLIEKGVEPDRLYNLEGGIMRWQKDVDPSMPRY